MAGKVVIDANTFVSAVLNTSSVPAMAVDKAIRNGRVLQSVDTWRELEDVLLRGKFDRYRAVEARWKYLRFRSTALDSVSVPTKIDVCRHPKDDKFLELAVDGRADVLITGDKDLLVLHPFRGIAIVTPLDYLER